MFVDSILNDIILGVLKTISIPGFLSAGGDSCDKLDTIGTVCCLVTTLHASQITYL